ncbi:class I SAM-dependent methyltransferase [Candidatus Parcubacteria bacterium]|nr:class I SAM-dependent methyltransferase [Patescibacteria group bacterium]MCG2686986.1 class I SAM-dependent methyltransferase [Candidatus Parcubacteria bacterium]
MKKYKIYLNKFKKTIKIINYKISGKKPWSNGYNEYKWLFIKKIINDEKIINLFRTQKKLPGNFGVGIDERVVEYPWIISNISPDLGKLLDAGSALNFSKILEHDIFSNKKIIIANLNAESKCYWKKEISYLYDDIRNLPFKDEAFDAITCVSTLEHVGMDNTAMYTKNEKYKEGEKEDYLKVIIELKRLLKQNSELLITVPFGEYKNFGFFQQFDTKMVKKIIDIFNSEKYSVDYYQYTKQGWQISNEIESSKEKYFNIHTEKNIPSDLAAAARSVACIKLKK